MVSNPLSSEAFDSPFGPILVVGSELGIVAVELNTAEPLDTRRQAHAEGLGQPVLATSTGTIRKAVHQLTSYLEGGRKHFAFDIDLRGTPFQRRVWEALALIPYGETRSYQQVAHYLGRPKSVRAVANACGQNPIPLVIPCHRVVASDGGLGGFSAGLSLKRRLLNLESGDTSHLPLFEMAEAKEARSQRKKHREDALEHVSPHLAGWLRTHLDDAPMPVESRPMTPEAWLAEVLEETQPQELAYLAESIAVHVQKAPSRVLGQLAEELVAAALTLGVMHEGDELRLEPLLRAAALIDSPFFEVTCRRILSREHAHSSSVAGISDVLRSVLDGSLETSKRLRDRAVDLWVLVEQRQPSSVWSVTSSDDPSAVYAAHGLWREALIMAENALAFGQQEPGILLQRISEYHEQLGEIREAYEATLRLVALTPSPEAKQRLRVLADTLESKDPNGHSS
jgi:methylated-DNA-[protein]-cysteine S-methyltransferase